jgi:hypothetical protein
MGKASVSDFREQVRAPVLTERDGIRIVEPEDDPLAVNFADNTLPILQWIEVGGYAEEPTEVRGWNVSYLDANGHIHDHVIPGARGDIACAVQRARELLNGLPAWAFRQ